MLQRAVHTGVGAPCPRPHRLVALISLQSISRVSISPSLPLPSQIVLKDFQDAAGANPARGTFSAAFILGEFHEEAGDIHHAGFFVHDHQAAGSHHGAGFGQRFIIHRQVQVVRRQAAAHRAAGLDGFEALVVLDSAANVIDDLAHGDPKWNFDQAGVLDIAGDGKGLGAFAFFGAHAGIPFRAVQDDLRDIRIGFNIVVIGRFAP